MGKDPARKGGGNKQRRGAKKLGLKRGIGGLASTLLKAIGASEDRRRASADAEDAEEIDGDVYEYEEGVPEEERGKNKRFDDVDRLEYELPSDFEDEEIDEDAAFGGDEDDAVLRNVANKRIKEINLNSDEENDEEDDDQAAMEDEDDIEDDEEGQEEEKGCDESDEEEEEEEEEKGEAEEEDEEEEEEDDDDDDEDDDEGKHRRMIEAITGKSASGTKDKQGRGGKERVVSEAYPESEFNLNPSSGNVNGITVEDLMTPLQDTAGFGTIRKRMEQLQKRGAPVEAPLPKVIQDRLNRKAAYQKTSEDVTKWQPLVKMNREARTLVFNKPEPAPSISTASLAASFKPATNFEKEVHSLLLESNLVDVQAVEAGEALELNKLTVEEVRERQERLAKMRNLLFRHEAKAKRLKKIKSKTFHRLLQKDQKSKAEVDAAIAGADPEASKVATIKREFNRAQERMTLKHKNSSRWAKRILKRGLKSENDGTRDAIAEQLRTHAALTRKMHSADLSDSDDSSSDSEQETQDAVSGLVLEKNVKSKVLAKAKVATLKALEDGDEEDLPISGLFSLPFMARAIEKKKKAAHNDAMAILEQLEQAEQDGKVLGLDEDFSRSQNGDIEEATTSRRISFGEAKQVNGRVGRRKPSGDADDITDEGSGEEAEAELTEKPPDVASVISSKSTSGRINFSRADHTVEDDKESAGLDHPRIESVHIGEISQNGSISFSGVQTVPAKKVQVSIAGSERKPSDIGVLAEVASQTRETGTSSNGVSTPDAVPHSTLSDDDSGDENPQVDVLDASGSQQDLIRQAFAGDDVEAEFEKAKSQALDEEVPALEGPVSLPGWGQWTRVQKVKGQPAWLVKEQEQLKAKRENALIKRKDAHLKHVIISEKQDKKAAKFTAPSIPFPFSSREVFERSMRQPIGRDFNTDKAFRDMTRPAVIRSAGVIIEPITLDKSSVKRKEAQRAALVTKKIRRR